MSLRISSAAFFALLSACGGPPEDAAPGNAQEASSGTPAEASAERIACAIGDAAYADVCTIERSPAADGTLLTIRHPDGGFRRLRLLADGRTVIAADGALPAETLGRSDAAIEVAIGNARYRLPTTR